MPEFKLKSKKLGTNSCFRVPFMPKDMFLEQGMDELVSNEPEKYTHFNLGYAVVH